MYQDREQNEDFGEVKHKSASKVTSFDFINSELVPVEEIIVGYFLLWREYYLPKLQLSHEVQDEQTLGIE